MPIKKKFRGVDTCIVHKILKYMGKTLPVFAASASDIFQMARSNNYPRNSGGIVRMRLIISNQKIAN